MGPSLPQDRSDESSPRKPGWYPSRYGVEGWESYGDGTNWTGDSRPHRPVFFGHVLQWIGSGVATGVAGLVALLVVAAIFGKSQVLTWFAVVIHVALAAWVIDDLFLSWWMPTPRFLNRPARQPGAVLVTGVTAIATVLLGFVYLVH